MLVPSLELELIGEMTKELMNIRQSENIVE
ncbi:MAG: hypothetical protein JWP37_2607 [Mucilaginibacter sp.]|nr:hypothetical protein [Mucilaginibacter sp.]